MAQMTEAEQRAWNALAVGSFVVQDALERQTQRDAGMPHAYYVVLVALYYAPGRELRMSALAETARMSRSRLSHAVRSMVDSGWVSRARAGDDGRGQVVTLTATGLAAVRRIAPLQTREVRHPALGSLSDAELDTLAALLERVTANLDPEAGRSILGR
jgi:DNA-binding MarR family transcriptional regulator